MPQALNPFDRRFERRIDVFRQVRLGQGDNFVRYYTGSLDSSPEPTKSAPFAVFWPAYSAAMTAHR